jgi:hypothetical protein
VTSAFELCYTKWSSAQLEVDHGRIIKLETVAAGMVAGSLRALIECPFEYFKVRKMVKVEACYKDCYRGFTTLYPRNVILLTSYFTFVDGMRRNTQLMDYLLGQFIVSGLASVLGYALIWPFEVVKNITQASNRTINFR